MPPCPWPLRSATETTYEPFPPPPAQAQTVGTGPGRTVRLFSLNDYLGLSTHPQVCAAAASAALAVGSGPRSSALVGGYTTHHRELESDLATLAGQGEAGEQ